MTRLRDANAVRLWLDRLGVDHVVVVSPHLDDAVYSIAGFMHAASACTEVLTLFTEGRPGQASDWARATGFADSAQEHAARRREDEQAMNRLGCRYQHGGLRSGESPEAAARQFRLAIDQARPGGGDRTLVLLPAGAGGPPPRSALLKLVLRGMRRPGGAMPHGEHLQTRDCFWRALLDSRVRIGFYAELPYAWAQGTRPLQQRLREALGCVTERVEYRPDLDEKTQLVELYQSQLLPVMGTRTAYRRRVLSRNECVCLVEPLGLTGHVPPWTAQRTSFAQAPTSVTAGAPQSPPSAARR